jgi:hypothetical protein
METFLAKVYENLGGLFIPLWIAGGALIAILLILRATARIGESWFKNILAATVALLVVHLLWFLAMGVMVERFAMDQLKDLAKYPPSMIMVSKGKSSHKVYGKERSKALLKILVSAGSAAKGRAKKEADIRIYFPTGKYTYSLVGDTKDDQVYELNWVGYGKRDISKGPIASLGWYKMEGLREWLEKNTRL